MARAVADLIRFEPREAVLVAVATSPAVMGEDGTAIGNAIIDEVQAMRGTARKVAFDLGRVSSINSVFLGALVTVKTTLQRLNVEFVLVGVSPSIRELMAVTRLERVFDFAERVEDLSD